jgi:hypothetical protein
MERAWIWATAVVLTFSAISRAADYVWIEGESPTAVNPQPAIKVTPGPPAILSGGKWATVPVDSKKIESQVPADGITLSYAAAVPKQSDYDVWIHVGFELARCETDWRLDAGAWQPIARDAPTVDVQELGVWAPVAWMNLGKQKLGQGNHTIEFRLKRSKAKDGTWESFQFGLDAICLTPGPFHPDGSIQPGDSSWMTEQDKAAAKKSFEIKADASQSGTELKGTWQYAGDDEGVIADRLAPVQTLTNPDALNWHALEVPGDRNQQVPDQVYVHRYYLRTRLNVPASLADHSFFLHMPGQSVIASVFVNGQFCGGTKNSWAVWDCDVTKAIRPGQSNELIVAFKDPFYALAGDEHPKRLDYSPYSFWHFNTTGQLLLPILTRGGPNNVMSTGFVMGEPTLVVAGKVYTSDVFAIPSVKNKTLGLEVTLHNPTDQAATVNLANEVEPLAGGAAEKTFAQQDVQVPAGRDVVVKLSEPWTNAKLWWPDDPHQYNVVTKLALDGQPIDQRTTKFGFREWTWDGPEFKLNGIPWHGFADCDEVDLPTLRQHGQNMIRIWWQDEKTEDYQNQCDAFGMVVRRTGIFDGQGVLGFYELRRKDLWDNYREQMTAWIKGLRNHPSLFMWSIENEITFINGHVRGQDELTTREIHKSVELFNKIDPTRPCMTDGGNALLDESQEVYGGHYMEPKIDTYPESAYEKEGYAHRQVWPMTKDKPVMFGETAWGGSEASVLATIGGEQAALGIAEARPATALNIRMLSEGFRWNGFSFQFWTKNEIPTYYKAWSPVAVFCRQWDWTFGSGQKIKRTMGIFNDTRTDDPITLTCALVIDGKTVSQDSTEHHVPAGQNEKFDVTLSMPEVSTRAEGTWKLSLSRGGATVFEDSKDVSVLPPAKTLLADGAPAAGSVGLFDPSGKIGPFLNDQGIQTVAVKTLTQIPDGIKTLIVGPDALDPITSTSALLSTWASSGRAAIVLDQKNPLQYQGLPGEMDSDTNHGCVAFAEDPDSPLFHGLSQKDLFCWGDDNWAYRDAYVKPESGGKSIIQCGLKLADSALVQMQSGEGVLLLSQLLIGEKLQTSVAAQYLLVNMLRYADHYKLVTVPTSAVVEGNAPLKTALDGMGLQYSAVNDPMAAISQNGSIAVIDASPANLKTLAGNIDKVQAFTQGGGWIIFNNLTPDGLADYNKLVGFDHVIRHYGKEKVTWSPTRNPLTAGLPASNIVMGSGKHITWFAAAEWPDPNGYSYVVDLDDAAPFATSTYYAWDKAINNYTMIDGSWQLIENLAPAKAIVPIKLAKPEKILQFTWVSDNNYQGTTKIEVDINGKQYPFDTMPDGNPQTFDITDQPTASELTVKVLGWTHDPSKNTRDGNELVGIDNIYIKVARPADFAQKVKPMLNIGAMVEYPQGKGGIILCNVQFRDVEENSANIAKKRTILATLLRNLQAKFAAGKTVVAANDLEFTPIEISAKANQYRGEQGWFGDKTHTFGALPTGKQKMADVTYDIYNFTTSIVPDAIMLGSKNIPGKLPEKVTGIPVNAKADALFFLQAAKLEKRRSDKEVKAGKQYEMADYIIHYSDGTDARVPIYAEIDVDNYLQKTPAPVRNAQFAWINDYGDGSSAVAYSMRWNNPHPDLEITSIDFVYGKDRRGVPALLAITAGKAR